MNEDGTWGTDIEILALSIALNINIIIFVYDQNKWQIHNSEFLTHLNDQNKKSIFMQLKNSHFQPVDQLGKNDIHMGKKWHTYNKDYYGKSPEEKLEKNSRKNYGKNSQNKQEKKRNNFDNNS